MGKKNKVKYKKVINESLEKPFLNNKDINSGVNLSSTRTDNDLYNSVGDMMNIANSFYSEITRNLTASEYIPNWRRLAGMNIQVLEAKEQIINESIVSDSGDMIIKVDFDSENISEDIGEIIVKEWKLLYSRLGLEDRLDDLFDQWYIDGVLIGENVYDNSNMKNGILKVDILNPIGFTQVTDKKTGEVKYKKTTNNAMTYDNKKREWTEEQISFSNSGIYDSTLGIYLSYLNYAMRPINQLNALENAVIVYALTRSTEKLVYYVDVGNLPEPKARAKIAQIATENTTSEQYDVQTGRVINNRDQIKLRKEIYLGTRDGSRGTKVENLSASSMNINELSILENFKDNVWESLRVSKNRRKKDSMTMFGDHSAVENEELNFYKFIVKLRKKFVVFFRDIFKKHLIAKEIITEEEWEDVYKYAIKFIFANNNNYAEIKDNMKLMSKIDLLNSLEMYIDAEGNPEGLKIFNKEYVLKNFLKFTNEELEEMKPKSNNNSYNNDNNFDGNNTNNTDNTDEDPNVDSTDENPNYNNPDKANESQEINERHISLSDLEDVIKDLQDGDEIVEPRSGIKFKFENGRLVEYK